MNPLPGLRSHCPACSAELSLHERHSGGYCSDWQCRRRRVEARHKAEFEQQMRDTRDAAAMRAGVPEASAAPLVFVRRYRAGLEAVTQEQRDALRAHLLALQPQVDALADVLAAQPVDEGRSAAAAAEPGSGPPKLAAEVDALLGQVCASCTGHCCRLGFGRHAFLDAAALFKASLARPGASLAELADAYLDEIPALHHVDSCAFHGEHGCALPRHRRAAICNDYECPGLEQTRQLAEEDGVRRVFVVRHEQREHAEGSFVPPLPVPKKSGV